MRYPPLPADEQIRIKKPLPSWWNEIESNSLAATAENRPIEYQGLTIREAILHGLSEVPELSCSQLRTRIVHKESSVVDWLNRLLLQGKVTYEVRRKKRFWRLVRPDETPPPPVIKVRTGYLQKRLLQTFEQQPARWFSPNELRRRLGGERVGTIIKSLHNLHQTGRIERRPDPLPLPPSHRHPYQYRWPAAEPSIIQPETE